MWGLNEFHSPVLIDRALVRPRYDTCSISVVSPLDVHALSWKRPVDDTVSVKYPLLSRCPVERLHLKMVALGSGFQSKVIEHGSDDTRVIEVPELIGRTVHLTLIHDDVSPRTSVSLVDVQNFSIHLAHDHKGASACKCHCDV